jgi:hypothetical protein
MKKQRYTTLILILNLWLTSSFAQTNVSGGIYNNTTWTLANSPYIVTDNIVVFPNVTLTIEAGVEVRFDNSKSIEVRSSSIVAIGSATDSITFTSNSTNPSAGAWDRLYLKLSLNSSFEYCKFLYANHGIYNINYQSLTSIKHSRFEFNNKGLYSDSYGNVCTVDSCTFRFNGTGIDYNDYITISNSIISQNTTGINLVSKSSITNCLIDSNSTLGVFTYSEVVINNNKFRANGTALEIGTSNEPPNVVSLNEIENNNIGFILHWYTDNIFCNKICNNTALNVQNYVSIQNLSMANNYWCTTDSTTIASGIHDGYDNVSLSLINFMPIDTAGCYLINSINDNSSESTELLIYPNPTTSVLNFNFDKKVEIRLYNVIGECMLHKTVSAGENAVDVSELTNGIYVFELNYGDASVKKMLIKK